MTYKFDKEKINKLLKEFYTISKVTMSVWDSDFNQITFYPNPMAPICAKIKSNEEGKKKCLESDICALKKAASTKNAYTFSCHAGLVDTVVPIYHNDELIAYIMFGQIKDKEQYLNQICEDVVHHVTYDLPLKPIILERMRGAKNVER